MVRVREILSLAHYLVLRVQPQERREDPVTIARRNHPFPSRTRKLSSLTSMILGGRPPGKVESCRNKKQEIRIEIGFLAYTLLKRYSSLAQSVERMTVNHDVVGSSPTGGAKKFRTRKCAEFLLITSSLFTFH